MKNKLTFIKTWEASGNGVFEPDMIVAKAYKSVFASYKPKHFLYYQKDNKNKLGEAYDVQEEMDKFNESGYKDFSDKDYVKKYFRHISSAISHNKQTTWIIERENLEVISMLKLARLFERSIESMKINLSYYLACQPQRFTRLEQSIQERLLGSIPKDKAGEVFRILSTPTETTPLVDEQMDWLRLILRFKKKKVSFLNREFNEAISIHHKKYAVLGAADGKDVWSKDHFVTIAKADKRSISAIQSEIRKVSARGEKIKRQQKNLIKDYKISSKDYYFCDMLAKIGHQRLLMRIDGWMPLYEAMKKMIRAIAKKYNYDPELIRFCTVDELINFSRGKLISKDLLLKRKSCFLLVYKHPNTKVLYEEEADKKFRGLVPVEDFEKIDNVKGAIAMKGKISGKVLLFQWGDDMSEKLKKIKDSEKIILVAGQTRPQLMPLIIRCSAIVTDEGGITSHSAIVSRELGIPCIVGTRIATRVFKDGDFIEVDADNGIVKIIK